MSDTHQAEVLKDTLDALGSLKRQLQDVPGRTSDAVQSALSDIIKSASAQK